MVASLTPLPVIGVPVRASTLDGLDSLLSIVQVLCFCLKIISGSIGLINNFFLAYKHKFWCIFRGHLL